MQGVPRKQYKQQGRTEFIDESFIPYADQWNFLHGVRKYTLEEVEDFICQLAPTGELGDLLVDMDVDGDIAEKPWKARKPRAATKLTHIDFPPIVKIVHANKLYIEKDGLSSPALNAIKRLAAFRNPDFYKTQAMRLSTHNKARTWVFPSLRLKLLIVVIQ